MRFLEINRSVIAGRKLSLDDVEHGICVIQKLNGVWGMLQIIPLTFEKIKG
jgi:hypothetical protein